MSINLTIDPGSNPVSLNDRANGWRLTEFDAGNPDPETQWATSADVEGSLVATSKPQNRTVTARVLIEKTSDALLQAQENALGQKLAKLTRETGELELEYPSGDTITFDVLEARLHRLFTPQQVRLRMAEYELSFVCKPYGRGAEQDLGDNVETTLPALVFTEADIPGDTAALGRLVVDNDASVNQWWLTWGIQSRYYSPSANAGLYYVAETRTLLSDSALSAGLGVVAGTFAVRNTNVSADYKAIMSTQATGGGAHLSHVGTFRVYARMTVWTGSGTVTAALEWSEGDFLRSTINAPVEIAWQSTNEWVLVDLGLVTLRPVTSGTQRWEGRIIAKSTSSNDVYVDYLMLVPVTEASGVAKGIIRSVTPTAYVGEDHFTSTTAAAALNARVAPTGGTWATSGDATDFAFDDDADPVTSVAGEHIKRTAVSGTNGRYAILGSTNYVNVQVEVRVVYLLGGGASFGLDQGVIARWVDSSNYLRATFERAGNPILKALKITQVVAGTEIPVASVTFPAGIGSSQYWWKIRLTVNSAGSVSAAIVADVNGAGYAVGTVMVSCEGSSSALATGGTLATGKPGIFDRQTSSQATTRYYDDFLVSSTASDAAVFANQSAEIRYDRVQREDSAGALWTPVSSYEGDYLRVPVSGAEARTLRAIVKMTRSELGGPDNAFDDISARLYVTPRYLVVPEA